MGNRCSAALLESGRTQDVLRVVGSSGGGGSPAANRRFTLTADSRVLRSGSRCTPLAYALLLRNEELAALLLAHGAAPDKPAGFPHAFSLRPLHLAVLLGLESTVTRLLAYGADPNLPLLPYGSGSTCEAPHPELQRSNGRSVLTPPLVRCCVLGDAPLHTAVRCGRAGVVQALLAGHDTNVNMTTPAGHLSPLAVACAAPAGVSAHSGFAAECVALLLSHPRVDPNAGGPLVEAISATRTDLIPALLAAGASVTARNAAGHTPLQHAVRHFCSRAAQQQQQPGTPQQQLTAAAEQAVRQLVAAGADVNQPSGEADGGTLLDYAAARRGQSATAARVEQVLRQCGAVLRSELQQAAGRSGGGAEGPGGQGPGAVGPGAVRGVQGVGEAAGPGPGPGGVAGAEQQQPLQPAHAGGSALQPPAWYGYPSTHGGGNGYSTPGPSGRGIMLFYVPIAAVLRARLRLSLVPLTAVITAAFITEELIGFAGWALRRRRRGGGGSGHGAAVPRHGTLPASHGDGAAAGAEGGAGAGGAELSDESGLCCVCMASKAEYGFVHEGVVHCCLCGDCELELRARRRLGSCLICKQRTAGVARVVAT